MRLVLLVFFFIISSVTYSQAPTAFVGATIIDGNGTPPIRNAVMIVDKGKIVTIGPKEKIKIPPNAVIKNLSGKTIVPGFINIHGHVGDVKGIEGGRYSKENIIDNLNLYASYGITTVVSLGGDKEEAESLRFQNDFKSNEHARLFIAGEIITGNTPKDAELIINKNHEMGVDIMKIRVDDNLGTAQKVPEDVYRTAIHHSHHIGYKIASHLYYLEDARKLLDAGTDMLAHSVRDKPVDQAFIDLIKSKKARYCATLTRELSTFIYEDTAKFFSDPFFLRVYDKATIQPLLDPARQQQVRNSVSAQTYMRQLPVAMANLKKLSDEGVPIVFGTDSGVPTRFIGYFEHLEMEMMIESGLTPMQIIMSATKNAAEFLEIKELGTLSAGHLADFIILDADPLTDIRNTRKISAVYIGGAIVNRK